MLSFSRPQPSWYSLAPDCIPAWQRKAHQRVTKAVHQAGGRIFLQLWHKGRISHPSFQPGGGLPVAPSAITWEFAFSARRYSVLAIGNGAGCGTPPVGPTAAVSIPVIAFLLAFLALRASNCNGWARPWGSGARDAKGTGEDDVSGADRHGRRKGDPQKVRIAACLRRETTLTLEWAANRLCLGAPTHVASLLQRRNQKGRNTGETLF